MKARVLFDALSLTPALSRWEREKRQRGLTAIERDGLSRRADCGSSLSQRERAGVRENATGGNSVPALRPLLT